MIGEIHELDDIFGSGNDTTVLEPSQMTSLRDEVYSKLKLIIDPDLHQDVVSLGFIQKLDINNDTGDITFIFELTTPACPMKDFFHHQATTLLKSIPWVNEISITFTAQPPKPPRHPLSSSPSHRNLQQIQHIVAISSCKGGVGKSTVALNLAYTLTRLGASVSLLDCDLQGPSLSSLLPTSALSPIVGDMEDNIIPLSYQGVDFMSLSLLSSPEQYHAMRGAIATNIIQQLLFSTRWGRRDILLLDLPPGTGDIHLSLVESGCVQGAIIVTTPHVLSVVDVLKGYELFVSLEIPVLSLVENLSYFKCGACEVRHELFDRTLEGETGERWEKCKNDVGQFLMLPHDLRFHDRSRFPLLMNLEESDELYQNFMSLGNHVVRELARISFASAPSLDILYDNSQKLFKVRPHSRPESAETSAGESRDSLDEYYSKGEREAEGCCNEEKETDGCCKGEKKTDSCCKEEKKTDSCCKEEKEMDSCCKGGETEGCCKGGETAAVSDKKLMEAEDEEDWTYLSYSFVRSNCPCSQCSQNKKKYTTKKEAAQLSIKIVDTIGNYAIKILWADRHETLLSYNLLNDLLTKKPEKKCTSLLRLYSPPSSSPPLFSVSSLLLSSSLLPLSPFFSPPLFSPLPPLFSSTLLPSPDLLSPPPLSSPSSLLSSFPLASISNLAFVAACMDNSALDW